MFEIDTANVDMLTMTINEDGRSFPSANKVFGKKSMVRNNIKYSKEFALCDLL